MLSRRTWIIAGTVVGVVAVGAVAGPLVYASLQEDAAPATTVQAQDSDAPLSQATDGTWTIGSGSSAGYRVDEVLNGADVTVAGTTQQVSGSLVVAGGDLTSADVTVDVASIATDSDRRDEQFRGDIMQTDQFPTATFTVADTVDLPELTGAPVTVPVTGELTLHGVTQPVTVDLSVVRTADGVQASGSIPVTFADYGVQAPDFGFVKVEQSGAVEFFLDLAQ
ncbi:YceI-like domain-containing protein [Klenkia soli]|uniref:YceI-like domain-containing protein n=1 Tax=Klenkia soli TaxID=1052260 RepID=A0A1H0MYE1_9ACTN|nr:YceI family protein [Klenkia soli]SDO85392.1 YceI-like domain-containing protein [Klenkia soli]